MVAEAIQSDGVEVLFEAGQHINVDIFSEEYINKINSIALPNTKVKILAKLLGDAIEEYGDKEVFVKHHINFYHLVICHLLKIYLFSCHV